MGERAYKSPVREEAKGETRRRIRDALVKVVLEDGVHAFSMENVAKKAGVALRTVYRHYETREQMLEELSTSFESIVAKDGEIDVPATVDDFVAVIAPVYRAFAKQREALSASILASFALRYATKGKKERLKLSSEIIAKSFPNLDASEREEAAAILISLSSGLTWFHLTSERGLSTERASSAVTWSLRTLFADLARRNRAAARR
jgi:AcrR family transcriptional regulator